MKRIILVVGIVLFIVTGCAQKNPEVPSGNDKIEDEIQYEIEQLHIHPTTFRYVVDWLSNEEVLFVEEHEEMSQLKAFHIKTKEITTIFEEEEMITNVFVHPMKGHLLVHTSVDDSAATVKIMTVDGVIQNELVLESVELEIEWNDVNPFHLLLTTFYEDWSFDTFYFNCSTDTLHMVNVEDPFPKWFGSEHFATLNEEAGVGEIILYHIETNEKTVMDSGDVIQFSTFKDSLFLIEAVNHEQVRYAIIDSNDDLLAEGFTSFDQPDLVAFQSTVEWLGEDKVVLMQPDGEIDAERVTAQYNLLILDDDGLHNFMDDVENASLICSPDGEYCITGVGFEQLIHMKTKEKEMWLIYDDEPFNENKQ